MHDPHSLTRLRATEGVEVLPPVPEEAIAAFERDHSIRLPADYRAFIAHAAAGLWMHDEPALFTLEDMSLVLAQQGSEPSRPFAYGAADADALKRYLSGPRPPKGLATDPAFVALQKTHDSHGCLPLTITDAMSAVSSS